MTYDDGRTTAPAYTISSLNEPKVSGELKIIQGYGIFWVIYNGIWDTEYPTKQASFKNFIMFHKVYLQYVINCLRTVPQGLLTIIITAYNQR